MKRIYRRILSAILFVNMAIPAVEACTNLIVGKGASTDGSTLVTYAADSHVLYGELYHWPAATHSPGEMLDVREWDTNHLLGQIPQTERTYNVVGNMNECQLTIGETTFGGREGLVDTTAVMDYGSLIYITLQRARTAREAIGTMTLLVQKYGYRSEGESFTIADPNEVWIMEMIGKGLRNKGAVWVAVRIPDDCISAHANHARIHTFPLEDPDNCIYSPDVISFARQKGYFSGLNTDFSFADAYAPADFEAIRSCDARVWSFYNMFSSGMDKYLPYLYGKSKEPLPLYIKPDRKISPQNMMNAMRDHFEGTPFDMTKDIGAGPFACPYRWRPLTFKVDSIEYINERAIATQQTGFSFVAQMRNYLPNPIGGVLWFGVDDAATSVYIPMYCSITEVPECFKVGNGDLLTFSWTSAFWINNWVANMAYSKYNYMSADIRLVQKKLEDEFKASQPVIEKSAIDLYSQSPEKVAKLLNDYSITKAQSTLESWKKLGEYLMVKYIDGNIKREKDGKFQRTNDGVSAKPLQPGYSKEFYKSIVKDTGDRLKVSF
ncbi:dipeptidase [Parabacteroides sp. FAFU027]|uniref:dipeptidase n=1 Tax=Parabacteroides sp. FAFU027 TaxID=2922715 RepID=UPI001FAF99F7|nr:C69 family dipeptidase [Parabacteroides sp. FAFU027]